MGLFDSAGSGVKAISPLSYLGAQMNQKEGAVDTGNVYKDSGAYDPSRMGNVLKSAIDNQTAYAGDPTKEVQNNGILGGLFGAGGTMDRANAEEQRLASQGYNLTPEDHEAYGQASGNIARQFGQSDKSLATALSNRGLSNSGVAGASFTGLQGNKDEQLAGLQHSIADSRMKMNQERLNQTRSFLSSLGTQANTDINSAQTRGVQKAEGQNQAYQNQYNMANGIMQGAQGQSNTQLEQQQQTAHPNDFITGLSGAMKIGSAAGKMAAGGGGMS